MTTIKISRTERWMKKARESWLSPFLAGTFGGFMLFWI